MNVLAILQIKCTTAIQCSNDVWVERAAEVSDIECGETEIFGVPVAFLSLESERLKAWLEPDDEFYGRPDPPGSTDWSHTEEFKSHVQKYLADGWTPSAFSREW